MNITIFGAGKTGQYLTKILTSEGHDLTVIESDHEICNKLQSLFDVSIIDSEGIKIDVFNKESFENCDLFIAVSHVDEMNITAATIAKKIGANKTVARVRNEDYDKMIGLMDLSEMGIDLIIHPEKELSRELANLIYYPNAVDVYELYSSKLFIIATIIEKNADIIGKNLIEAGNSYDLENIMIVVVEKKGQAFIPSAQYIIEEGDKIYTISSKEDIPMIFRFSGYKYEKNKDIMINGSGKIALKVAEELDKRGDFNVKIIVNDEVRANHISELLSSHSLVIRGEATDIDVLASEGILDTDFYLALTNNDETNMVSSLLAKHLQVKNTITLIEKTDYLPISLTIGLQRCINSSIATSNAIMKFVKQGKAMFSSTLKGTNIEVLSFRISEKSKYLNKPLNEIKIPKKSIIGAVLRDQKVFVPSGLDQLFATDEIVIFAEKNIINKWVKMFG